MTTLLSAPPFDKARAEAFAGTLLGHLNGAALALMISLGHRTGLFDVMGDAKARSSAELARDAGLSERYVREWLGSLVTGGVVEFDPAEGRYRLPPEHAAWLTRRAVPNNIAQSMQWVAVLGAVEDDVLAAFTHGKGVRYERYGQRFHDVMADESNQTTIAGLTEHIIPLVPGLSERLERGIEVLDVGCGKGLAMAALARRFPLSRFTGVDLSEQAIDAGRREARAETLANLTLVASDVTSFGAPGSFDLVTAFDAIHDQAKPAEVLANVRRVMRPGGVFLMQDIKASSHVQENMNLPLGPFTYAISCMHCMCVSLAHGGPGLGAAWGRERALAMLADAGFGDVRVHELPHDIINYYYIARAP